MRHGIVQHAWQLGHQGDGVAQTSSRWCWRERPASIELANAIALKHLKADRRFWAFFHGQRCADLQAKGVRRLIGLAHANQVALTAQQLHLADVRHRLSRGDIVREHCPGMRL